MEGTVRYRDIQKKRRNERASNWGGGRKVNTVEGGKRDK